MKIKFRLGQGRRAIRYQQPPGSLEASEGRREKRGGHGRRSAPKKKRGGKHAAPARRGRRR